MLWRSSLDPAMTGEHLKASFQGVFEAHKAKLAPIADFDRQDGTLLDPIEEARQERAMGRAYTNGP